MRCFVGIELPEPLRTSLVDAMATIRAADSRWRDAKWVKPEQLHVTVKFLGELDSVSVDELVAELGSLLGALEPFALEFLALAAVPATKRARMIWASMDDPSGRCGELAEVVDRAALNWGVALDERSFKPHVTLCRARRPQTISPQVIGDASRGVTPSARSMSVVHATVFSSRLTSHGPIYSELARLPLGRA